jgi:hypothetical protein
MMWSEHSRSEVLRAMARMEWLAKGIAARLEQGELTPAQCMEDLGPVARNLEQALSAAEWDRP